MAGALLEVTPSKLEDVGMKPAAVILALVTGGCEQLQVQVGRALEAGASEAFSLTA